MTALTSYTCFYQLQRTEEEVAYSADQTDTDVVVVVQVTADVPVTTDILPTMAVDAVIQTAADPATPFMTTDVDVAAYLLQFL